MDFEKTLQEWRAGLCPECQARNSQARPAAGENGTIRVDETGGKALMACPIDGQNTLAVFDKLAGDLFGGRRQPKPRRRAGGTS